MTSENLCVRCGRPTPDGNACADETRKAAEQLRQLVDMLPAARDVAHGLSRRGGSGSTTGKPGSQIPIDLTAMAKLDAVQHELSGLVRLIAEERGVGYPVAYAPDDQIARHCGWLPAHLEWLRHHRAADEFLAAIEACARVVAGIARGPAPQKYLGPCGAEVVVAERTRWRFDEETDGKSALPEPYRQIETCDGDIYAREGASNGSCRLCGAQVSTDARRAWLDAEVRSHAFRAAEIANAYGINVKTIRSWATERQARYDHSGTCVQTARPAKLRSYWRTETGLTVEWVDPVLDNTLTGEALEERLGEIADEIQGRGGRLHYVGDVLDLAAGDAARREEARAERARRKEASAA